MRWGTVGTSIRQWIRGHTQEARRSAYSGALVRWDSTPLPVARVAALATRRSPSASRLALTPYSENKVSASRQGVARVNPANRELVALARRASAVIEIDEIWGDDVE
jgi:hypothetical protein